MRHARVLYHLVRADFLERARRYSFLLTLGFAVYLAFCAGTGRIVLRLDDYRGVLNSAWLGSTMTLVGTAFLSIAGFYIVKGALLRDEQTRVGQILATGIMRYDSAPEMPPVDSFSQPAPTPSGSRVPSGS